MKQFLLGALRALPTVLVLWAHQSLCAQNDFAALRRALDADRDAMVQAAHGRPGLDDVKKLADATAAKLEKFLAEAKGEDAANARLMLANVWLEVGASEKVKAALAGFDPATTPPLALVAAAELAARVGANGTREEYVEAAVAAKAPFEQRMALAIFLATRLVEIQRADAIFEDAAKEAKDDEARARVAWFRVLCLRSREDLEEDAWIQALEKLAKEWPSTYWGGVARDLRKALDLHVGDTAIDFSGRTLDDKPLALSDLRGKVVLLEFWGERTERAAPFLQKLQGEFGERGLQLVGVAAFEDAKAAKAAAQQSGRDWPQLFDGRGMQTDVALRYGIERLPDFLLIDRKGKVAALRCFLDDETGRAELHDAIADCIAAQ